MPFADITNELKKVQQAAPPHQSICENCEARERLASAEKACRNRRIEAAAYHVLQAFGLAVQQRCDAADALAPAAERLLEVCRRRGKRVPQSASEI